MSGATSGLNLIFVHDRSPLREVREGYDHKFRTALVTRRWRERAIGGMRALNRHVVREFNSDRKETHWGKRKLMTFASGRCAAKIRWMPAARAFTPRRCTFAGSMDLCINRDFCTTGSMSAVWS
jgi:hypothetical protein